MAKIFYVYGKTGTGKTVFLHEFLKRYGNKYYGKEISYLDNEHAFNMHNQLDGLSYKAGFRYTGQPIVFDDDIDFRKRRFDSQIYNKILVNHNTIFIFTSYYPVEKYKWLKDLGKKYELKTFNLREEKNYEEIKKKLDKTLENIIETI